MELSPIFFYLFAGMALACSLLVILKKSAITSAFNLILVFFAFAGIYAQLGAHLVAALQVLVYAGAVMVLFVFVIMLLNADGPSLDIGRTSLPLKLAVGALCLVAVAVMAWTFKSSGPYLPMGGFSKEAIVEAGGNTQVLSELMFSDFILPFELTSVLLLSAIVGAVAIAMRKKGKGGNPHAS